MKRSIELLVHLYQEGTIPRDRFCGHLTPFITRENVDDIMSLIPAECLEEFVAYVLECPPDKADFAIVEGSSDAVAESYRVAYEWASQRTAKLDGQGGGGPGAASEGA